MSAKTDKNVERAFSMLAEAILDNSIGILDAPGPFSKEETVTKVGSKCCQQYDIELLLINFFKKISKIHLHFTYYNTIVCYYSLA